jgi:hypothetical protein
MDVIPNVSPHWNMMPHLPGEALLYSGTGYLAIGQPDE